MADLISRKALRDKAVKTFGCIPLINEGHRAEMTFNEFIAGIPSVDAVQVVRCRDCKYSYFIRSVNGYECSRVSGPLRHGNDFCSYGEEVRNDG